jgi:aspartate racemase
MARLLDAIDGDLAGATDYLASEVQRLARAGADFAVLASNTPHIVFDELSRRSPLPLISIVQSTYSAAREQGLTRLGLLGTRFTMQGRFYQDVFSPGGIELVVATPEERAYIHEKYMAELVKGEIVPATRERLLAVVEAMKGRDRIDGLILGGTDLPPMIPGDTVCDIPVLDTTRIHVNAAVTRLLG